MRKQNSEFKTALTLEGIKKLHNTDAVSFVELDKYACYIIANGIDDDINAKSARLACDTIVAQFLESPSMSKNKIKYYIKKANEELIKAKSKMSLKSSITIIVTNYVKMRYGQVGNTRFRLYRNGFLNKTSKDQSLAMDMIKKDSQYIKAKEIRQNFETKAITRHREKTNLYTYLGQVNNFSPYISKKIKLMANDVIVLYTKGVWENISEEEIKDIIKDATDDPTETVSKIEDLLLSKQDEELEQYAIATIFANKIFQDPNRKRKIRKIIMISIPIIILLTILITILVVRHNKKINKIYEMNTGFINTIEYIQVDNYIRADEENRKISKLAKELKDKKMIEEIKNQKKLIESVLIADENFEDEKYKEAINSYKQALKRDTYTDNIAKDYIEMKLLGASNYLLVYDYIALGDSLLDKEKYDGAEQKYLDARNLSSKIYFDKGRDLAMKALDTVYQKEQVKEEKNKKAQEKDNEVIKELLLKQEMLLNNIAKGDEAFNKEEYTGAKVFYLSAIKIAKEIEMFEDIEILDEKIANIEVAISQINEKNISAEINLKKAKQYAKSNEDIQAKKYFTIAKNIYAELKNTIKVDEIDILLEELNDKSKKSKIQDNKNKEENNKVENNNLQNNDNSQKNVRSIENIINDEPKKISKNIADTEKVIDNREIIIKVA